MKQTNTPATYQEPHGFKGTKTEWAIYPKDDELIIYCDDAAGSLIANCNSTTTQLTFEEKKANAALIAQAKELAKLAQTLLSEYTYALKLSAQAWGGEYSENNVIKSAKQTLTKAGL